MDLKSFLFIYSILFIPVFNINGAAKISEKKEENINLNNALLEAIINGDESRVEKLIKDGANVNAALERSIIIFNKCKIVTTYPIHEAIRFARQDNVNIVKLLVESQANVNQVDEEGTTPLILAAITLKKDIVKFLLTVGADINISNLKQYTALELAKNMIQIFKKLPPTPVLKEYEEIAKLLEEAKLKQDLEEKRKKTTQILIESGHLIEPLAKLTAEYTVSPEDIK